MPRVPNTEYRNTLPPGTYTTTGNSTGIDISDMGDDLLFVLDVGVVSGTTPTFDGKIQDSADNSNFADVTGATFPTLTTGSQVKLLPFDRNKLRRFVRFARTIGGTSPSFAACGGVIDAKKYQ